MPNFDTWFEFGWVESRQKFRWWCYVCADGSDEPDINSVVTESIHHLTVTHNTRLTRYIPIA